MDCQWAVIISWWVAKLVLAGELPLLLSVGFIPLLVHPIHCPLHYSHHLSFSSLVKRPLINRSNQEPASQKKKHDYQRWGGSSAVWCWRSCTIAAFFNWIEKASAMLGVGEAGSDGLHRSVNFLEGAGARWSRRRLPFPNSTPSSGLGMTHASKLRPPRRRLHTRVQHGVGNTGDAWGTRFFPG